MKSINRKCSCGCKQPATGGTGLVAWASLDCAVKIAEKRRAKAEEDKRKAERKELRERKQALLPIQHFLKKTERAVHAYIRERDREQPCISCGTWDTPEWHAGHFIPVGRKASIRFDYSNIHKQCQQCNTHFGGNQANYEMRLTPKIGAEEVERLKCAPIEKKWTREELAGIEAKAKSDLRALIAERERKAA